MPDLIAELAGYRAELARYERDGKTDRAAAVRQQLDAAAANLTVEADKLDAQADNHTTAGQDLLAARATIEARRLRAALADLAPAVESAPAGETASDSTPRETAVHRKGRSNA